MPSSSRRLTNGLACIADPPGSELRPAPDELPQPRVTIRPSWRDREVPGTRIAAEGDLVAFADAVLDQRGVGVEPGHGVGANLAVDLDFHLPVQVTAAVRPGHQFAGLQFYRFQGN